MQRAVPDPVADVEADPAAVFDAHGADSVDELVASGAPEPAAGERSATDHEVAALFDGDLDEPERESARDDRHRDAGEPHRDDVLEGLEAAADGSEAAPDGAAEDPTPTELAPNDPEVADALAAAADVDDAEADESDLEAIPFFD